MDADKAVTATFTQDCYELVVTIVGSGTVDQVPLPVGDPACYLSGTPVTLTPIAALDWSFAGWSGADVADLVDAGGGDWTILMDSNKAVTATFELNPCCDLDAKLTVNSIEWYKDPSDSIWKVKTDCKVVDNTCGYWLTVEAELFDDSSVSVVVDASVSHGQKFTAKSTLSSGVGGITAPTGYSVTISFYDRDGLCEPYVQEGFDIPYPSI